MGTNERKILKSFFTDLLKMHDINDVAAAMTVALDESAAKPITEKDAVKRAAEEDKTSVSLPDLFMMKLERFGNVYGIWVRKDSLDARTYQATITEDGRNVAEIYTFCGKDKCTQMAKGALWGYLCRRERKLRRTARKGAK